MSDDHLLPDGAGAAALALITVAIRDHGAVPADWDGACGDADPKAVAIVMAGLFGGLYHRVATAAGPDAGTVEEQWAGFCARITSRADTEGLRHFL